MLHLDHELPNPIIDRGMLNMEQGDQFALDFAQFLFRQNGVDEETGETLPPVHEPLFPNLLRLSIPLLSKDIILGIVNQCPRLESLEVCPNIPTENGNHNGNGNGNHNGDLYPCFLLPEFQRLLSRLHILQIYLPGASQTGMEHPLSKLLEAETRLREAVGIASERAGREIELEVRSGALARLYRRYGDDGMYLDEHAFRRWNREAGDAIV